jgi:tetratricopeptide (TPR) repeat protein
MRAPAFLIAAMILGASIAASAQEWSGPVPEKARALADRGRAFHDAGDYDKAIAAFTQAYAMAPSPALLFNLAQAYRLRGNCDTAALMYRRYLASNADPEGRALAETHLASVERCLRKLRLHIPADNTTGNLMVPAPNLLATTTTTTTTATTTGPPRRAQIEKGVGIGLALSGGGALAVATYYAVRAHDAANDVEAAYQHGAKWKDIAPLDARGKQAQLTARILGVAGAVGAASGVVLYMLGTRTERTSMTVAPRGHGAEIGMLWTF